MATTVAGVAYTSTVCALAGIDLTALLAAAVQPGDITPSVTPNTFVNTGKTLFVHINGSGITKTVIFNEGTCNFGTDHDKTVTTAGNKTKVYGPFPVSEFGSLVTFSAGAADTDIADQKVLILEVPWTS